MKNKRLISIFMLVVILITNMVNIVYAAGEELITYEDMKERVMMEAGLDDVPGAPEPNFYVMANGEKIAEEYADDLMPKLDLLSGGSDFNIPIAAYVPVGTELTAISTSLPGKHGTKIEKHDWQIAYWDTWGKQYKDKDYISKRTKDNKISIKADREGHILFFLNVMDDAKFYYEGTNKPITYDNWSDYAIRRNPTDGYVVGFEDGRYKLIDWYFTPIRIKVIDNEDNLIMRELEVIDPETDEVLNKYERTLDPEDPFHPKKAKIKTLKPDGTPIMDRDKTYKIRAKYQFLSFSKGGFDINNPDSMNEEQRALSTEIDRNELLSKVALDNKLASQSRELSIDKPNERLYNLEEAVFEWDYTVPQNVKETVKIKPVITNLYDKKNIIKEDDFAELTFKIRQNDIAATHPLTLTKPSGKGTTDRLFPKKKQKAIVSFKHVNGKDIIGTDAKKNPKLTVDVRIRDSKNNIILEETLQSGKEMKPNDVITLQTSDFTTDTKEIKVCTRVNPIHKELGYNFDTSNDEMCKTFESGLTDLGMSKPVILKEGGRRVNNPTVNSRNQVEFTLKHYSGEHTVGTGTKEDPRIAVNVTVSDGNKIIMREKVIVNREIKPGDKVQIKPKGSFKSSTGKIINPIHIISMNREIEYKY